MIRSNMMVHHDAEADTQLRHSLLTFMKEFFNILKTLSRDTTLLKFFKLEHMLDFFHSVLSSPPSRDVELLTLLTDLLLSVLSTHMAKVREYILLTSKKTSSTKILP